jgi:hypothetical protein
LFPSWKRYATTFACVASGFGLPVALFFQDYRLETIMVLASIVNYPVTITTLGCVNFLFIFAETSGETTGGELNAYKRSHPHNAGLGV